MSAKTSGLTRRAKRATRLSLRARAASSVEFGLALHVEFEDAGVEREINLRGGLADAGEDDAAGSFGRGGEDALELAAGDDVKARATSGQQLEDGQRGVGLDGVADKVVAAREGLLKEAEALGDLVGGINVERRSVAAR